MKFKSLVLILETIVIFSIKINAKDVDLRPECGHRRSDFIKVVNTTTFIDKTMFMKTIIHLGRSLLTAPQGFGKTTNLDMVKRFLEIKVNENGDPKDIKETLNYKLYKDNNLKITKNETFFNKHFGKYPVLHIDYSGLCGITSFDSFVLKFLSLLKDIFLQKKYLLRNPNIWSENGDKEKFLEYMNNNHSSEKQDNLIEEQLNCVRGGLGFLSRLLFQHFNKRVFVLIDEIDTFLIKIPQNYTLIKDKIDRIVRTANDVLLKSNKYVSRALIMGDSDVVEYHVKLHPKNIRRECVLYEEFYFKYFGITEKELEELLPKVLKDEDEKNKLKLVIEQDANKRKLRYQEREQWECYGSFFPPKVFKLYSFHSFINFLQNKTKFESNST